MVSPTLVASVLTIIPAMGAAAYILNRYEGYFEQARLFLAIIFGLFAGLLAKGLEVYIFPFDVPAELYRLTAPPTSGQLVFSLAYTAVGFAMLASVIMTAVLGLARFRARKDAPYYGTALGLALGSMWALQAVALYVSISGGLKASLLGTLTAMEFLLVGSGIILAHGAAGAWIGQFNAQRQLRRAILFGTLWLIPVYALYWVYSQFHGLLPALAIAATGFGMMAFARNRVLDKVVPPEIREQLAKQQRRDQRRNA